jgi:hypothetical protein
MWRYLGLVLVAMVGVIIVMGLLRYFFGAELVGLIWLVLLVVGIVVIVRNLTSNRKVSDAGADVRRQALAFTPDASRATLYVLRTQFLGMAVGINVEVDGKPVAQLKSPRFTRILLTPGTHRVGGYTGPASGRKPGGELDLSAAPGEIIVVMCEVEPGMVGTVSKFKRVELETVRAKLQSTRMVAPDLAEV